MKITTKFIVAAILVICGAGLVIINQLYPNLDKYEVLSAKCAQCGTVYSYISTPDGKEDAHACTPVVNDSDSLIADETWICTDTDSLGFTFNKEIAELIDAQPGCQVVAHDGDYYWFTYTTIPHICTDPTHVKCDGECECDSMECFAKTTELDFAKLSQCDDEIAALEEGMKRLESYKALF